MERAWGQLSVADAHVHFLSHRFFSALAEQKKAPLDSLPSLLEWQLPDDDPQHLAATWVQQLDRQGVARAALIASIPGDYESVIAAVRRDPQRFYRYTMVKPAPPAAPAQSARAVSTPRIPPV